MRSKVSKEHTIPYTTAQIRGHVGPVALEGTVVLVEALEEAVDPAITPEEVMGTREEDGLVDPEEVETAGPMAVEDQVEVEVHPADRQPDMVQGQR